MCVYVYVCVLCAFMCVRVCGCVCVCVVCSLHLNVHSSQPVGWVHVLMFCPTFVNRSSSVWCTHFQGLNDGRKAASYDACNRHASGRHLTVLTHLAVERRDHTQTHCVLTRCFNHCTTHKPVYRGMRKIGRQKYLLP